MRYTNNSHDGTGEEYGALVILSASDNTPPNLVGSVVGNLFLGSIDTLEEPFYFAYRHLPESVKQELLQIVFCYLLSCSCSSAVFLVKYLSTSKSSFLELPKCFPNPSL